MLNPDLKILKVDPEAVMPHKNHALDACYDIHILINENNKPITPDGKEIIITNNSVVVLPHQTVIFHTGLKCATPAGYVMRIYPRSSTGIKRGLVLANSTAIIDTATYRGEILLAFRNEGESLEIINHLDKLAQIEIGKVLDVDIKEVHTLEELGFTERGENGIGSSGR